MTTKKTAETALAELFNLVAEVRRWQLAFQIRPASPAFVMMRAAEKKLDQWLADNTPPVPVVPDLKGAFP